MNSSRPATYNHPDPDRQGVHPTGRWLALALVLAILLVLPTLATACSAGPAGPTGSAGASTNAANGAASGSGKRFITSVYPLYLAAAQIAKGVDGVMVQNLTGTLTGCLHDYQLTTGNMKALEKADAFIINGAGLEGYLETVARDIPKLQTIEAANGITLNNDNPHVWVSISLMIKQVENIARGMGVVDPTHKDAFDRNAKSYLDRLATLRDKMHATIDPLPQRRIVTVHEAFPYFASEFGLEIAGVVEREPDSEPSAAELAATIRLIREQHVQAVFVEPQYPVTAATQIAKEAGAKIYTLDPGRQRRS